MPAAYQLPNTLDFNTANLSDVWLGSDYPGGSNSFKFTVLALKNAILAGSTGTTNIGSSHVAGKIALTSSSGTGTDLLPANISTAGVMLPDHFRKLSLITIATTGVDLNAFATSNHPAAGALDTSVIVDATTQKINVKIDPVIGNQLILSPGGTGLKVAPTDLTVTYTFTAATIASSTGGDVTVGSANSGPSGNAGLLSRDDKNKLENLTNLVSPTNIGDISAASHQPTTNTDNSILVSGSQVLSARLATVTAQPNQLALTTGATFNGLFVQMPVYSQTPTATQRTVTLTGVGGASTNFILPAADTTNAGLFTKAMFDKFALITVTGAVSLDTLLSNTHPAVTAANASILVNGQAINVRLSATAGNSLTLDGTGLYVAPTSSSTGDRLLGLVDLGTVSGAVTINLDTGASRNKKLRATGNITSMTVTGAIGDFKLAIDSGGFTVAWPTNASFTVANPTLTSGVFVVVPFFMMGP